MTQAKCKQCGNHYFFGLFSVEGILCNGRACETCNTVEKLEPWMGIAPMVKITKAEFEEMYPNNEDE
jgi:hypothetical protein